jgi:predicted enzyme involved in methoxymalonyl-ACP biosynthesis
MEFAMLDELVSRCRKRGINEIIGYYFKTPKNNMVAGLYDAFGFEPVEKYDNGNSIWRLKLDSYTNKNKVINVNSESEKCYD